MADFARIGSAAGDRCGLEFQRTYPAGTNADPRRFFPAVLEALDNAGHKMLASGVNEEKVEAWRNAFMLALDPYTIAWREIIRSEH